jgi:SOS-response transcriptional repressor LexA
MSIPTTNTTPKPIKRRMRKSVITDQRKQLIVSFIHEYRRMREISPSIAEITKGIGYSEKSEGQVHTYVNQLIDEGWLRKAQGASSRSLIPIKPHDAVYAEITDEALKDIKQRQRSLRILRRL